MKRLRTNLAPLDTALDGGIARGAVTIVSGDRGVGKTTLLAHLLGGLEADGVLYLSPPVGHNDWLDTVSDASSRAPQRTTRRGLMGSVYAESSRALQILDAVPPDVLLLDEWRLYPRTGDDALEAGNDDVMPLIQRIYHRGITCVITCRERDHRLRHLLRGLAVEEIWLARVTDRVPHASPMATHVVPEILSPDRNSAWNERHVGPAMNITPTGFVPA